MVPELVERDSEGYLAVAYARACALVAAAVKELRDESRSEIASLRNEVESLKALVNSLIASKSSE